MPLYTRGHLKTALRGGVSFLAIAALTGTPTDVYAQFGDITVTARKREQNLQDVPLSIATFNTAQIERQGLTDFQDYAKFLTSVSFGTSSPGASTIAFRGAVSQPSGFDTVSSSTIYLDEIPVTRDGQNPDIRLIDIERLEALSGPQPTIYGAGAQSGTLKIVTNKPDTSEFGAFIDLGAGKTKNGEASYDVSGMVNIPIIEDKLAVRLVGFYEEEGGYIDNVLGTTSFYSPASGTRTNAAVVEEDINNSTSVGARAHIKLNVNENWTVTTGVTYQDTDLDYLFDSNPRLGDLQVVKFKDENRNDNWYNLSFTVEGDLGFANLVSASGYHRRNIQYDFDGTQYATSARDDYASYTGACPDVTPLDYIYQCYYNLHYGFGPDPTALIHLDQRVKSFVQEIRLTSKEDSDSRFGWLIGAFYEKKKNDWEYTQDIDDLPTAPLSSYAFGYYYLMPTTTYFSSDFYRQTNEQIAVFGEVSIDITDRLEISGGGRWFRDEQNIKYQSSFPVGVVYDAYDISGRVTDFASRANATYRVTDDFLAYFTRSEGTRIGGTNNLRPGGVSSRTYDPDKLINYEIGVKTTWWDGRIVANLSAFMMKWKEFQIQTTDPVAGNFVVVNVGQASIDGIEGNFAVQPMEGLEFSSAFTYLDAKADTTVMESGFVFVAAGDLLPTTPKWKLTASAQYTHVLPWADTSGYARFDFSHVGNSVNGIPGSLANFGSGTAVQTQPNYQIGNLRLGIEAADWEVSFAVNNIWDERAVEYIWPRFGTDRFIHNRPRELRIGMRKTF